MREVQVVELESFLDEKLKHQNIVSVNRPLHRARRKTRAEIEQKIYDPDVPPALRLGQRHIKIIAMRLFYDFVSPR